jgi:hypothetical protein
MVLKDSKGVLKEDGVAAELGEEEAKGRDDGDRGPIEQMLGAERDISTVRTGGELATHAKVALSIGRDCVADKVGQRVRNVLNAQRIAANQASDFGRDGGKFHSLGQLDRNGRAARPGDPDNVSPGALRKPRISFKLLAQGGGSHLGDGEARRNWATLRIHQRIDPQFQSIDLVVEEGQQQLLTIGLLGDGGS